jgi:hypothetical protein
MELTCQLTQVFGGWQNHFSSYLCNGNNDMILLLTLFAF